MSDRQTRVERKRHTDRLRRSIACITPGVVLVATTDDPNVWRTTLARNPTRLPTVPNLTFRLDQTFELRRDPLDRLVQSHLTGYRYELAEIRGREIFAYHLHPGGNSQIDYPHLHVGTYDPRLDHGNKHLPTGLVTLEQVIHCLITEFEIPPLRPDWADILAAGQSTIHTERSV